MYNVLSACSSAFPTCSFPTALWVFRLNIPWYVIQMNMMTLSVPSLWKILLNVMNFIWLTASSHCELEIILYIDLLNVLSNWRKRSIICSVLIVYILSLLKLLPENSSGVGASHIHLIPSAVFLIYGPCMRTFLGCFPWDVHHYFLPFMCTLKLCVFCVIPVSLFLITSSSHLQYCIALNPTLEHAHAFPSANETSGIQVVR